MIDFIKVYRLYRRHKNSVRHSAKAAWNIAIVKLPF
jgi:hypothetical protein